MAAPIGVILVQYSTVVVLHKVMNNISSAVPFTVMYVISLLLSSPHVVLRRPDGEGRRSSLSVCHCTQTRGCTCHRESNPIGYLPG